MKIKNVDDIFELAGGSVHLASKLDLHQTTVLQWRKIGVPIKYWAAIIEWLKVSAQDLFVVSEHALNGNKQR
jgi:hypothetical protein